MSGRLCFYKQQQHCTCKLVAQFVFEVCAFRFEMRAPLHGCRINNVLIQFVTAVSIHIRNSSKPLIRSL